MNNHRIRRTIFQCILAIILMASGLHVFAQAPTATTAAAGPIGGNYATVNGTVNANGLSTVVYFEYGLTDEYGGVWAADQNPVTGSTGTAVTATLISLDFSTTYHYRVVATSTGGTTYGTDMTFTTAASGSIPLTATTVAATGVGGGSATLNGAVLVTGGASTTVSFQWGTDTGYGNTVVAAQSPITTSQVVSAALSGLPDNTVYHYRVVASNVNGTVYGADMTFTMGTVGTAPTATTAAATGIGTTTATMNGTVNANSADAVVIFEYGLTTGYGGIAVATQSPVTGSTNTAVSVTLSEFLPNTLYHYRVSATNIHGTTDGSDMTFTTLPAPPTVTTGGATSVTTSGAVLNGTVNANNASSTVTFQYGIDTGYGTTVTATQSPVTGSTDTAVSRSISGLTNGITYHYRVVAQNAGGAVYGADMTFTTGAVAPTATTNAATGVGTTAATLNGTVNANNNSTTVTFQYGNSTNYNRTVTATPGTVTGSSNTAVSAVESALTPNMTYHYRVAASNAGGTTYGADMNFTTGPGPAVTTAAASGISIDGATLNGTVNADNDSTTVTIEYGLTAAYGTTLTADQSPVTGTADTAVSVTLTNVLASSTVYHYRVVGQNSGGTTYGADMIFTTAAAPPQAPTAVTLAVSGVSPTTATLNGSVDSKNYSTTVTFEYGLTTAYGTTVTATPSPIMSPDGNWGVSAALSGLTTGMTYHYRVVAQNAYGTAYGADMTFFTAVQVISAVTGAATGVTSTTATLNGTVDPVGSFASVTFEYGLTTGYGSTVNATPGLVTTASAVTASLSGLTAGNTYHYRVVLRDAFPPNNVLATGGDMTFTTIAPPTAVTDPASGVGAISATLNGTVNSNGGSTAVTFQYGLDTNYGNTVTADQSPVTGSTDTAVSSSLTTLQPNTTYHYRVATDKSGGIVYGADVTFTTAGLPPVVTTDAADGISSTGATLHGTVRANNDSTTVTFEYGLTDTYGTSVPADQSPVTGNLNTAVSVAITGLSPNTTYHYRVVGVNGSGTVNGADMTFFTGAGLPTVTTGAAGGITSTGATLNGTVNANNASTTVTFEYGETTGYGRSATAAPSPVTGTVDTAVSAVLTGLNPNITYHYRVVGVNGAGTANGADMTFTTNVGGTPTVTTTAVTAVTAISASSGGNVTDEGGAPVTARGVCWSTAPNPTTSDSTTSDGTGAGAFTSALTGLSQGTTYYVRAYAVNLYGTAYGVERQFTTTAAVLPTVTTAAVTNITATSARSGGNVTDEGDGPVTARGVCWSTAPNPTTAGSLTVNGTGAGVFTSTLGGLSISTTYYVRAYATSTYGTSYGNELSFTTLAVGAPTVVTEPVTDITTESAVSGGDIPNNGGAPISAKGVCWSTSPNPTTADNTTSDGIHASAFTSTLTGLSPSTTYYVRAYAVNSAATGYGREYQFTTDSSVISVDITNPGDGDVVSGTVTIAADASVSSVPAQEEGLYIARVEFYIDDTLLATDTTSPYETPWDTTTAADGDHTIRAAAYDQHGNSSQDDISVTVGNEPGTPPEILLNRSNLNFGSVGGITTGDQTLLIDNNGGGTLDWTATTDAAWLACTPGSGVGPGEVSVSVDPAGLAAGTYSANVTITDDNATNSPVTLPVNLTIYNQGGTSTPFGTFDTPGDNTTVMSSIPVTGWVLDDIEVTELKIYRDAVSGEGGGMVYIGDAVFVDGARPDVEAAYPTYPLNYRAGWGYMLLTYGLPNQGNGTFTLHAVAADAEGGTTTLGSKTITCDNANAVKPFGAIDAPAQGGTASGASYANTGWALTPQPNSIPTDGSTIFVVVDGVPLGNPVYNIYRSDIEALFPGYANSGGAGGYFYLDTTAYANGIHTIAWTAADSGGNTDGIGSRYFSIVNTGSPARGKTSAAVPGETVRIPGLPIAFAGETDVLTVNVCEPVMVRVVKGGTVRRGYVEVNGRLNPLPIGSTLDTARGIFYWGPGPGFAGTFPLVFEIEYPDGEFYRKTVTVTIATR